MTWWIVVLLMAVALSPLAWLVPSQRQQKAMAVRLQARQMGLAMQLAKQDWPYWLASSPPTTCPQYYRVRPKGRSAQWCYWQFAPGQWVNRWREPCEDAALLVPLQRLPVDVYMVEANAQVVALYWGEQGGVGSLQQVADALAELA